MNLPNKRDIPDIPLLYKVWSEDWSPLEVSRYPNQEPLVTMTSYSESMDTLLIRPRTFEDFMAAYLTLDAMQLRRVAMPTVALPLVPGSRQDRLNLTGDYLFTLKSVAALLNRLKLPEVLVVDPHSDVTPALINNCKVLTAANILEEVVESLPTYDGVIAPDGGATKRAQGVATLLGIPLYHAWKTRDVATGKLDGFGCQFLGDGRYLVVDDICDGGGTFLGLARSIKAFQQQVVLDLYVTHGYFSKGTAELKTVFDNIITTDSVIAPSSDDVHIINVWSDF